MILGKLPITLCCWVKLRVIPPTVSIQTPFNHVTQAWMEGCKQWVRRFITFSFSHWLASGGGIDDERATQQSGAGPSEPYIPLFQGSTLSSFPLSLPRLPPSLSCALIPVFLSQRSGTLNHILTEGGKFPRFYVHTHQDQNTVAHTHPGCPP